ncbi:MAG TPA: DEAD/DEAH box helicase [Thermoleophilia bacterium]|nr:DEAD/DEAH box helicase [Thermoleophilia bacterium]
MTPSTTDTTISATPERAPSTGAAPAEGGQKPRRKRGGRRRHGSGGADGAAQTGGAQTQTTGRDTPAAGYAAEAAQAAPAVVPERVERSGDGGESRSRRDERGRDDRGRRDDRGGKGRGDRDRDRGRGRDRQGRGGQGVDESYTERKHIEQPAGPAPEVEIPAFAALGLEGKLLAGVAAMGYSEPTPIQEHAIPRVLAGRDVVGCAQTGTGKTAAFVLPILQNMSKPMVVDGKKAHPTALVVTPTRELCGQIEEVGETLATYSGRRVVAVFGGVPYDPQAKRVRKGVDLLVATPGRLLDMLRQGDVLLDKVDTLVLDEADRMLDMGFWPDVKRIIDAIPSTRQNLFFSATMSKTVLSIIADTLHDPIFIELGGTAQPVDNVEQRVLPVNHEQKVDLLVEYFRHHDPDRTLVFTRTRRRAERLARTLNKAGITCEAIHGDRTQGQRQQALDGFKNGKIAVLVATDVVARGIDVDNITHVINFDIPTNPEDYVHRIGRTARAGASGIAVSLLTAEDVHDLVAIERLIGATLERHDLPDFEYDKRVILESSQVRPRPGKLLWNGGAHRAWNKTGVKRRVPGKRSR